MTSGSSQDSSGRVHGLGYAFSGEATEEASSKARKAARSAPRLIWEQEVFLLVTPRTCSGATRTWRCASTLPASRAATRASS